MGLERGPLSLVGTIKEMLGTKISGSGVEIENTVVGIRRWPRGTFYPEKVGTKSDTGQCPVPLK
jgi:hypothetical protein